MITRRKFVLGLGAAAAASFGLGSYAFALEPFRLVVTEWDLPTARWPYDRPLRIVIVTDVHACRPWMPPERIRYIVERANALQGDIILVLGDYVSGISSRFRGAVVAPREWGEALSGLSAPLGVHAIMGNHDWWWNPDKVKATLAEAGIPLYQNRAAKIAGATPFWLAGTDSIVAYPLGRGEFRGADDLPGTLAQLTDGAPAILMAHEPDLFVDVPGRFAVTLSGHTHGGQIWLPVIGRPVIPSAYGQRFAYGHIREDARDLIVSAGLGCSIAPVRFGVPPELTVVTLRSAAAGAV